MPAFTRTVEVKVVAEYWATIELDETELNKTNDELEEMAWREFYDEANRASIEKTKIESDSLNCDDCGEVADDTDHECED